MVICMRNKEKGKKNSYNNSLLIVINLMRTDVITIRGFHRIIILEAVAVVVVVVVLGYTVRFFCHCLIKD